MSSIFVRDGLCWLWQTVIRELHFLASIRLRLLRIALVDTWYLSATLGYWTADKNKLKRRSGRELVLVVISKYDKLPRDQFQLDWERKRKRVTIARTASTADTISRLAKSIREITPKSIAKFKVLIARDKSKKNRFMKCDNSGILSNPVTRSDYFKFIISERAMPTEC